MLLFPLSIIAFGLLSCVLTNPILKNWENDKDYAIFFDAGSKGTRLYLFEYISGDIDFNAAKNNYSIPNLDYEFNEMLYCELDGIKYSSLLSLNLNNFIYCINI